MFYFLKFSLYFIVSFSILCIPLQNKLLFVHLYQKIAPRSEKMVIGIKDNTQNSLKKGFSFTKKFFENSKPTSLQEVKDSVSSGVTKISNGLGEVAASNKDNIEEAYQETKENISAEEEKFLQKILKESKKLEN